MDTSYPSPTFANSPTTILTSVARTLRLPSPIHIHRCAFWDLRPITTAHHPQCARTANQKKASQQAESTNGMHHLQGMPSLLYSIILSSLFSSFCSTSTEHVSAFGDIVWPSILWLGDRHACFGFWPALSTAPDTYSGIPLLLFINSDIAFGIRSDVSNATKQNQHVITAPTLPQLSHGTLTDVIRSPMHLYRTEM